MTGGGLDLDAVRARFPGLDRRRGGLPCVFVDGPGLGLSQQK